MRATAGSMNAARRLRRQLSLPEMLLWRLLRLQVIRIAAADVLAVPDAVADGIYGLCEAAAGHSTTQPGG